MGTKTCVCGRVIEWNPNYQNPSGKLGRFMETATGQVHNCPQWVPQKRQQEFADNKAKYGSGYQGPSQDHQMQKDLANIGVEVDGLKLRVTELEREANRFIELTDAIAKELKIRSFKTASELETEEEIVDESTN